MKRVLGGKAILVVDDYPVMRKAIRDMLYTLEADTVYEADCGQSALEAMKKTRFDIVLCDYNLGEGRNGQQVLEEARYLNLLGYHTIFIIIAADQTSSMVLGALESKADEYMAKPFNAQQLFVRLERNLARKKLVQRIERDMDWGRYQQAIRLCDRLLEDPDIKLRIHLLKMRAELAVLVNDFETGRQIYRDILLERDLPWARLGLGIIEFHSGNLQLAHAIFAELLKLHPMYLDGYDWMSKVYEAEDRLQEVLDVLNQAVDLSPQSILRQKKLAETADKSGNVELAEKAYKATVSLGKHSIHKSCSDFSNLAKLYCKTQAEEQALKILHDMRQEYCNNPEAELRAVSLEVELHSNSGNEEQAKLCLQKAVAMQKLMGRQAPKDIQLDIVRNCFLQNQNEEADAILEGLIKAYVDDDDFLNDMRRMQASIGLHDYSEALIENTKRALVATNNQGVTLYRQGNFKGAMELFEQAMIMMPDNKTILSNMLNIIMLDLKTGEVTPEKLKRARALFKKARQINVDRHKLSILQTEFSLVLRRYSAEARS